MFNSSKSMSLINLTTNYLVRNDQKLCVQLVKLVFERIKSNTDL